MRVFLFGFLLFQLIIKAGYSQDYKRIAESNKEFLILNTIYSTDVPLIEIKRIGFIKYHRYVKFPIVSWSRIIISQDTLIDSKRYFSVIQSSANNIDSGLFIREDSNKVYLLDKGKQIIKLYDFNVRIKDTIDNLICERIDTIVNQGLKRQRINLTQCCSSSENATWIQGLGNMKGIIYHKYELLCGCKSKVTGHLMGGGKSDSKLIRVKKDNKIVYLDSDYNNFDFNNIRFKEK